MGPLAKGGAGVVNVCAMPPALIIYTDRVLGPRAGGDTRAFVIFIRPKYRGDVGMRMHELQHVRQWWTGCAIGFLFGQLWAWTYPLLMPWWEWLTYCAVLGGTAHELLYYFVRRYRMWGEAQAYREQMRHPDRNGNLLTLDGAAARLADEGLYHLGITVDQARGVIRAG